MRGPDETDRLRRDVLEILGRDKDCSASKVIWVHMFACSWIQQRPLVRLDATPIDLRSSMFDWARLRRTQEAIRLQLLLNHDGYLSEYAFVTEKEDRRPSRNLHE